MSGMMVTEIMELDKKRIRIFLEGGNSFVLYRGEGRKYHLQEGSQLSQEQYEEICSEILTKRARRRTMHLLEKMDRTESQLRVKLQQGFYPEDIIEDAIGYVKSFHYLDDLRYAQNYVRNQREKKSQRKIWAELVGKGSEKETAAQALEEEYQQEKEQDLILKWIEKKNYFSETADWKEKQRMYQFLMRKGFQPDDILHALDYLT